MTATPQLTIRMPSDIRAELARIALERDRSLAYVIIAACREYVARNPALPAGKAKK